MKQRAPINIFRYTDYRKFLRDWCDKMRQERRAFSFRSFAQRAGFKSINFFKLVLDGERNLTEESLAKCVRGLRLNKQEEEFLRNLVFFTQAKNHTEKDFYYKKMLQSQKYSRLKPIEKKQYDYCSAWYHAVVRELILAEDFDGTAEWLAAKIAPSISVSQAEKSLQLLESLGFIQKDKSGKWKQSDTLLTTGAEVHSVVLMNYHLNLMDLTKNVLVHVPGKRRDVSALTLGIRKEHLGELKRKIQEFRQEVLKMTVLEEAPDEVVQLNIQLYPLTREDQESTNE